MGTGWRIRGRPARGFGGVRWEVRLGWRSRHLLVFGSAGVTLGIDDPGEAERIFHVLSENGTVQMPIQETFWARRFGMLVDQF